ncbi:MAG: NAD(P)H-hydrate dehydratase [Calditrichaceae bacterium]|nr:NAD(P)H-hydrate dehydratase [Calditrichaceae bacterium]
MKISRVKEMQKMDAQAVKQFGIKEEMLMENAGLAVYNVIKNEVDIKKKRFAIFCGGGNNGGDGFVAARKIHSNGGLVHVYILGNLDTYKDAAKLNLQIIQNIGIEIYEPDNTEILKDTLSKYDIIVDGIFGTGLDREVEGKYKSIINLINEQDCPVFSLDIPSGVHGDTGHIMGTAVRASHTISFGLPKLGNLLFPGFEIAGKLHVTHISFPPEMYNHKNIKVSTNDPVLMPGRRMDSHKGSMGKVLFIAGSNLYLGAPYFAAQSFLKAGGGLSFLATPESVAPHIASKGNELVVLPLSMAKSGSLSMKNLDRLLEFSDKVDMVVIGPGISLNRGAQNLVRSISAEINKPVLIDGDGLTAIAKDLDCIANRTYPSILTPHMGEMSRLTGKSIAEINKHKIDALQVTSKMLKTVIVLKGAHSLIGYPDGRIFINLSGNPGMATAGSGDVLTGTIAGMLGLGLSVEDAVRNGVFIHGFAGDLAAKENGQDGLLATDIMNHLPEAIKLLRRDYNEIINDHYNKIHTVL